MNLNLSAYLCWANELYNDGNLLLEPANMLPQYNQSVESIYIYFLNKITLKLFS